MTGRPRDDHGRYQGEKYIDGDFLDAVAGLDTATTTRVAGRVGCERTTAYGRLKELERAGQLDSEKIGNALVWTIVD